MKAYTAKAAQAANPHALQEATIGMDQYLQTAIDLRFLSWFPLSSNLFLLLVGENQVNQNLILELLYQFGLPLSPISALLFFHPILELLFFHPFIVSAEYVYEWNWGKWVDNDYL